MKERGRIEKLWRIEKYNVLMHSQKGYLYIRELLKTNPTFDEVEESIIKILKEKPTKGSVLNAYDHMWGYFKKVATDGEKEKYLLLRKDFQDDKVPKTELLNFLKSLAYKYEIQYLIESTILQ